MDELEASFVDAIATSQICDHGRTTDMDMRAVRCALGIRRARTRCPPYACNVLAHIDGSAEYVPMRVWLRVCVARVKRDFFEQRFGNRGYTCAGDPTQYIEFRTIGGATMADARALADYIDDHDEMLVVLPASWQKKNDAVR